MEGEDKSGEITSTPLPGPKEGTLMRVSVSSERRRSPRRSSNKSASSPSIIPEVSQQQEEEAQDAPPIQGALLEVKSSQNPSSSFFRPYQNISSSQKSFLRSSPPPPTYQDVGSSSQKQFVSSPDYPTFRLSRKSSLWPKPEPNPSDVSSSFDQKLQSSRESLLWLQSDPDPTVLSSFADPKPQSSQKSSLRPQPEANPADVSSSTDPESQSSQKSYLWPQPNPNLAGLSSSVDLQLDSSQNPSLSLPPSTPIPRAPNDRSKAMEHTLSSGEAIPSMASRLFSFVTSTPFPFLSTGKPAAQVPPATTATTGVEFQFEGSSATLVVPVTEEQGMAEFLQKRSAAAAHHRQKLSGDPTSPTSKALIQRRTQVLSTVQKARDRLSSLSIQSIRRKREVLRGCWGSVRKWVFDMEQRRLRGKGTSHLKLWNDSLKKMESNYGSSMMLAFSFIRWVLLLNLVLAILWLAFMILPFLARPPQSFHWHVLGATFASSSGIRDIIQGKSLERTFVFYGGYTYTYREQKGLWRVDYIYPLLIGATFLISFLSILGRIARRMMNAGDISMAAHYFPFSSLVFASWDFHITSLEAAAKLRRGIRMQLKELYADALIKRQKESGVLHQCMSAQRFLALCVLWPMNMVGVVFAVDNLTKRADSINSVFGSDYAQAFLFGLLNNTSPVLVRLLVEMENFRPATAERVLLTKLFFLRFLNLATFYYSSIRVLIKTRQLRSISGHEGNCFDKYCAEGLHCCDKGYPEWDICDDVDLEMHLCVPTCAENYVGEQILRLIVIASVSRAAFELAYGYGYLCCYHGNKRQLLIEDMAMDIVYVQALVWWGVCFSPMAPILGFFSNLFIFYTMRLALFKTCAPVERAFSASRTSTLTYGVLLFTLILSTIPVSILVMEKKDGFCGPIYTQNSMYDVISAYMQKAPSSLYLAFTWVLNPAVLLGVVFFLIFIVVLVQSQLIETRQFLALTKFEMGSQRKEFNDKIKRMRQELLSGLKTR